jgi:hypothetical protein
MRVDERLAAETLAKRKNAGLLVRRGRQAEGVYRDRRTLQFQARLGIVQGFRVRQRPDLEQVPGRPTGELNSATDRAVRVRPELFGGKGEQLCRMLGWWARTLSSFAWLASI